jgi:hypothetical protein
MTDIAYRCHDCGSVHELESIRENLLLNLRPAASYGLPGRRGSLEPRERFLRWRVTRGMARALWPAYSPSSAPALGPSVVAAGSLRVFPPHRAEFTRERRADRVQQPQVRR